jgi:RHS repeat-associated protein
MIETKDPMDRIIVQNTYDTFTDQDGVPGSFGRVIEQRNQGLGTRTWKLSYSGWSSVEEDPAGGKRIFYFDERRRSLGVMDSNGNRTRLVYDGQGNMIESWTPKNEPTYLTYNADKALIKIQDALGKAAYFAYDSDLHLQSYTDFGGEVTTYTYTPQHEIETVTQPNVNDDPLMPSVIRFAYNSDGTLRSVTDQDQKVTSFLYDSHGEIARRTHPITSHYEAFIHNDRGDLSSRTDANGVTTTYDYNKRCQLTAAAVVRPAGNVSAQFLYDDAGKLWKTIDPNGNIVVNNYSATQRLLTQILPQLPSGTAPVIVNEYDARDWLQTRTVPISSTVSAITTFGYDSAGRLTSLKDPLMNVWQYGYDEDGHRILARSPLQTQDQTTLSAYNSRGEQTTITDAAGFPILFTYDDAGNVLTVRNRNNGIFSSTYYGDGRLASSSTPWGAAQNPPKAKTHVYNKRGFVASVTKASGQQTTFVYDDDARLAARTDGVGTSSFTYDNNGNLLTHSENGKTITRSYDELNRVTSYTDEDGSTIGYEYDDNSNLTRLTYPGGTKYVDYSYDSHNRLTQVTDWAGRTSRFEYDLAGRLTKITRPNETVRNVFYDAAGHVTEIQEIAAGGNPISLFRLAYDEAGRIDSELISPIPAPFTEEPQIFTYDADNRIATYNTGAVSHDADGNTLRVPWNKLPPPGQSYFTDVASLYTFDARNRLRSRGVSGTTLDYQFRYDSEGNRLGVSYAGQETQYTISPHAPLSQVLVRTDPGGSKTFYVYGIGLLYQVDDAGNTVTYHYDSRGSTVALSGADGQATDRIQYSIYGRVTRRTGITSTPFLFNGRYGVMEENGLYYMRARYYDPMIRRFINADPLGMAGGLNWYVYADGNPVSMIDPFGLAAVGEAGASYWVRNLLGAPAGFLFDQAYNTAATTAGLLSETIGTGLDMAGEALLGNPNLGESFRNLANSEYNSRNLAAGAGAYDPNSFGAYMAGVAMLLINPESALAAEGEGAIQAGEITTFQDFVDRSVVGDNLEGHELWQHANLKAQGLATERLSTAASQNNPVIALDRTLHQQVNGAQGAINAATQTPLENINANAAILRNLNIAPQSTIDLLQQRAIEHARSLGH